VIQPIGPAPSAKAAAVCARLVPALPTKVDDLSWRPVKPAGVAAAAWGKDQVVVLRCGVPTPGGLTATSFLNTVNEVDWFMVEQPDARLFTTVGRVANVELTIPVAHDPAVGPLVDVAAAIDATDPRLEPDG
jgi:hypothetical protein